MPASRRANRQPRGRPLLATAASATARVAYFRRPWCAPCQDALARQPRHHLHQFLDRIDALRNCGLLLGREFQLDDPLYARGAQDHRHADIVTADAVLLSQYAAQGISRFLSRTMASTICAVAAAGA